MVIKGKQRELCENMKDAKVVFNESLKTMAEMIDSGNIRGCYYLSSNMTIFSHLCEYYDAVLIAEVLSNVFSEIGPLLDDEKVTEYSKQQALKSIKQPINEIIDNYQKDDKNILYAALRELRVRATDIQLKCWKEQINVIPEGGIT